MKAHCLVTIALMTPTELKRKTLMREIELREEPMLGRPITEFGAAAELFPHSRLVTEITDDQGPVQVSLQVETANTDADYEQLQEDYLRCGWKEPSEVPFT